MYGHTLLTMNVVAMFNTRYTTFSSLQRCGNWAMHNKQMWRYRWFFVQWDMRCMADFQGANKYKFYDFLDKTSHFILITLSRYWIQWSLKAQILFIRQCFLFLMHPCTWICCRAIETSHSSSSVELHSALHNTNTTRKTSHYILCGTVSGGVAFRMAIGIIYPYSIRLFG